jgi:RNA polymerase sigma factor (sigma-70 family)
MATKSSKTSVSLQQWHRGDGTGLDHLLEQHLSWILNHVRRRLGPALRQKAESGDFVQEAVIQFLRYGPRIHVSDDGRFRALMSRIVENVLRDRMDWYTARRRALSKEHPLPPDTILNLDPSSKPATSPSQAVMKHEQEAWVRLGLELLDPEDREVIILRDWDGFTFVEIGERLEITRDVARHRYKQSFSRLMDKVKALRSGNLDHAL